MAWDEYGRYRGRPIYTDDQHGFIVRTQRGSRRFRTYAEAKRYIDSKKKGKR